MAKRGLKDFLFKGWHKWPSLAVGLAILVALLSAFAGRRIEMWWATRDIDENASATMARIRLMGRPYRHTLESAIRSGDYSFRGEVILFQTAFADPFYLADSLRSTLSSSEPLVRRAAVLAYLDRDRAMGKARGKVADDVFYAIEQWTKSASAASPYLASAIRGLASYRDPRIPKLLVPLLLERSAGKTVTAIGRANDARASAAGVLSQYLSDAKVAKALKTVVLRPAKKESSWVRTHAWKALASGGYSGDPDLYWVAARSQNALIRQMVADNLQWVKSRKVIPILEKLLVDRKDVVRRGALDSLIAKRDPIVMNRIYDLAEDQFSSIRGDLADAVSLYRRKDLIPFVAWCLTDTDPIVVEKSILSLFHLKRRSVVFDTADWQKYQMGTMRERSKLVHAFMDDSARKEKVIEKLAKEFPPRYTNWDRIPHLIAALKDADPDNVLRAIRLLVKITGRKSGFDPDLLDPGLPAEREANALQKFLHEDHLREKTIADFTHWWKTKGKDLPKAQRPKTSDSGHPTPRKHG